MASTEMFASASREELLALLESRDRTIAALRLELLRSHASMGSLGSLGGGSRQDGEGIQDGDDMHLEYAVYWAKENLSMKFSTEDSIRSLLTGNTFKCRIETFQPVINSSFTSVPVVTERSLRKACRNLVAVTEMEGFQYVPPQRTQEAVCLAKIAPTCVEEFFDSTRTSIGAVGRELSEDEAAGAVAELLEEFFRDSHTSVDSRRDMVHLVQEFKTKAKELLTQLEKFMRFEKLSRRNDPEEVCDTFQQFGICQDRACSFLHPAHEQEETIEDQVSEIPLGGEDGMRGGGRETSVHECEETSCEGCNLITHMDLCTPFRSIRVRFGRRVSVGAWRGSWRNSPSYEHEHPWRRKDVRH